MAKSATLKNDQWFKFYYLRILVSCKGWKDDEFGAYVKLLIHQFDNGFIPNDEKEIKKIITSHKKNWNLLKQKFSEKEPGKLVNDVMKIVRDEYDEKKKKNTEIGKKGGRPKTERLLNGFKKESHIYSSSLSNSDCIEGGVGETNETLIIPNMLSVWKDKNPKAFIRLTDDSEQLMGIARQLKEWMGLQGDIIVENNAEKIKKKWEEICEFLVSDSFLKNYSLVQINNHIASVIQAFNNRNNGSHQQAFRKSSGKSEGAEQLANSLKDFIAATGIRDNQG